MKRINVLFVMLQMKMGGAERLIHNLISKIDRSLFNPSVAWFIGEHPLNEFQDLEIPLYFIPKIKSIDFAAMRKLASIIQKHNIHIVNAHHFMPFVYSYYGSKVRGRAKLIYTEHSEWEIEKTSLFWMKMGHYLLNYADGAVGVSKAVARQIRFKFNLEESKAIIIYNGVNIDDAGKKDDINDVRTSLKIESNDKVIGIVANYRKNKNHIFLLRAFNELLKHYSNVKLLLIGQGFVGDPENSESEIIQFIADQNLSSKVFVLGYRSNVPELLRVMDIFCLISFKEGLPLGLIEAMASGLPVIGTNVEGIQDIIMPNKNGLLVRIGDVEGLKTALLTLIQNESLMHRMGLESKKLVADNYSLKHCIKQYQDLFMDVMD